MIRDNFRAARHVYLNHLSRLSHDSGTVSRYERGKREPSLLEILKFS